MLFKVAGRIEVCGNHTDHQNGCVITAAIDSYIQGEAEPNESNMIHIRSEGYPDINICIQETGRKDEEKGTPTALVRGMLSVLNKTVYNIGGFDATITSELEPGAGLSSSAAFEVLIGRIINGLFCHDELSPLDIAKAAKYAENTYYGKPCGLMDQMACAVGGFSFIDFSDIEEPIVKKIKNDPSKHGFSICMIRTGEDHSEMTEDYSEITNEMSKVSAIFGKKHLADVAEKDFYAHIRFVRDQAGDRATLRAIHFFDENRRVKDQLAALQSNNYEQFMKLTNESGISSWTLLQNVISSKDPRQQEMAYALSICSHALNGRGAARVHGGGFAGSVLAWVPNDILDSFIEELNSHLYRDCVSVLSLSDK